MSVVLDIYEYPPMNKCFIVAHIKQSCFVHLNKRLLTHSAQVHIIELESTKGSKIFNYSAWCLVPGWF